jgi:hypothetical protein
MRTRKNKLSKSIKNKNRKGGGSPGQRINLYKMVDELIFLGKHENMTGPNPENTLQNKYVKIIKNIRYASRHDLKECFVEIHHIMFKIDPRYNIRPIDLYHRSLKDKLRDIKKRICSHIECKYLANNPESKRFDRIKTRKSRKSVKKRR